VAIPFKTIIEEKTSKLIEIQVSHYLQKKKFVKYIKSAVLICLDLKTSY